MSATPKRYRPTAILCYEDCPRAYYYRYVRRLRPEADSANLVFGTVLHEVLVAFLRDEVPAAELPEHFVERWRAAQEDRAITYARLFGPEDLEATGRRLCELFPPWWAETGLLVLRDEHGPVIERRFQVEIAGELILTGEPDLLAMDREGQVLILDFKTTSSEPRLDGWVSDQLLAYQVLVGTHAEALGIDRVAGLGFIYLVKAKVPRTGKGIGPRIAPLRIEPTGDGERVREYIQKVLWVDEDIRKGRFPRRSRMAYNTPCALCDYQAVCWQGDTSGLREPEDAPEQGRLIA